jgi:hypothetical protein
MGQDYKLYVDRMDDDISEDIIRYTKQRDNDILLTVYKDAKVQNLVRFPRKHLRRVIKALKLCKDKKK